MPHAPPLPAQRPRVPRGERLCSGRNAPCADPTYADGGPRQMDLDGGQRRERRYVDGNRRRLLQGGRPERRAGAHRQLVPSGTSADRQRGTVHQPGGNLLVQASLQGADVVVLLAQTNRLVFSVMADSSIASGTDLKGKRLGITRTGSSTPTAALQAL